MKVDFDMEPGWILVVEDEVNIRTGLCDILRMQGHEVREASSGENALEILESFNCEVALVDIRMPGMTGINLLEAIANKWSHISVIILTGHGTLESAMSAVKMGASDYLLKPAQPAQIRESVARGLKDSRRRREQGALLSNLQKSLQRLENLGNGSTPSNEENIPNKEGHQSELLESGELSIDQRSHEVRRGNELIELTPSEYSLLVALISQRGKVLDYKTLVEDALGYTVKKYEARELIKRHIFSLRQKIEIDPAKPHYIKNVRGVGYRLERL